MIDTDITPQRNLRKTVPVSETIRLIQQRSLIQQYLSQWLSAEDIEVITRGMTHKNRITANMVRSESSRLNYLGQLEFVTFGVWP